MSSFGTPRRARRSGVAQPSHAGDEANPSVPRDSCFGLAIGNKLPGFCPLKQCRVHVTLCLVGKRVQVLIVRDVEIDARVKKGARSNIGPVLSWPVRSIVV